jgi:hypothetical protein
MSEMMMTAGFDEMVRNRAYALWEREGRPLGRDAEHWLQSEEEARRELQLTAPARAPSQPKAKAASMKKASSKRMAMGAGAAALA